MGAEGDLKKAVEEIDGHKIRDQLFKYKIDWVKNPAISYLVYVLACRRVSSCSAFFSQKLAA